MLYTQRQEPKKKKLINHLDYKLQYIFKNYSIFQNVSRY